ncbi:universal stress protein [Yinghuangia sp. ASG 101]|uniref:universal stress protein n=1 Tax=Yinghuangia sp. ASG 101 TaxID=2896848 RepID=UPI001E56890B|nr:universal stress protein [Yinghuangia sp. ASG 101]UGQ11697.1 universal stress protein [Yinghuangia sp. ASG 101]
MAHSDASSARPHITAAVDGSAHADEALRWAVDEAARRGLALRILHAWPPLAAHGGRDTDRAESRRILGDADLLARDSAPGLAIATVDAVDTVGAALTAESESAALLVLGSRGRGGFRSLLLGSTSLTAASVARCPVVVVRARSGDAPSAPPEVVVGVDGREPADAVLAFAFEEAAARPGTRLRIVHGWRPEDWTLPGGPVFTRADVEARADRGLAEATAGWSEKYPQVDVVRDRASGPPATALVRSSAGAVVTVVGRRVPATSLGLRLSPVAHAVLLHAHGPVAVVPHR